jgi:hypothetical protein
LFLGILFHNSSDFRSDSVVKSQEPSVE